MSLHHLFSRAGLLGCVLSPLICVAQQTSHLPPETEAKIAEAARAYLQESGTPSVQLGLIQHGKVVYTGAFGAAQMEPRVDATTSMPYGIGSVSKQFTAAAVMMLVERGKLRLDDPVSTWLPDLPHAREVTLRQLLNQVSGYEDFYTEDYPTLDVSFDVDSYALAKKWASRPLDFTPGTKWQYSNTNYLLVGLIVQKVAGEPFFDFLRQNVLLPAGLTHVVNLDAKDAPVVPRGYLHYAFGPARPAPPEGKGTLLGAGQLAMPIGDLLLWDTVVLHRNALLKPTSWQTIEAEVALPDGRGTGYGMGMELAARDGHRMLLHTGGLTGFVTMNALYPDLDSGFAAVVNSDASADKLYQVLSAIVTAPEVSDAAPGRSYPVAEKLLKDALSQLQQGRLDPGMLAPNLANYFKPQVVADYQASLNGFGQVTELKLQFEEDRGGMQGIGFLVTGSSGTRLSAFIYVTVDGKLDQLVLEKVPAPKS